DGARTEERFPMGCAGRKREGGWHKNHLRALLRQLAVQFWKPQIVTDRETKHPQRRVTGDDFSSRLFRVRFFHPHLSRNVYIKQVDLPVMRKDLTVRTKQETGVIGAIFIALFQEGARQ